MNVNEGLVFLGIFLLIILFGGEPDLMDAVISYLECKQ